ncbi:MAG: prephenate dehydrogenase [Acidaminococcaceae bacterium]|nr:prephenate dehydrogenase [Acidaminococcaceae bacterium]MBO5637649.1 prephenate dehydrogenase [Acidaminococcaceae bacterium]MBP3811786.1 prephenate dehydrogenase [Acidaminococcaceae bacterium]HAT98100.1 prephenate dehydrogenase/arogenate dehydrogenase family protein [Acidaminococcaceae bacterium]
MAGKYLEKPLQDLTFAIVGLGLIGGSYAKALRNLKVRRIMGMDISHGIARACLNANMIDEIVEEDGSNLKEADVIICSVYPEAMVDFVRKNITCFAEGMLLTDATGVKGTIPCEIQAMLPEGCEFLSGHPMAGRQGSGLGMSDAAIFINSNYIIVPTDQNTPEAIAWLENFAKAIGCARSVKVSMEDHDKIIAYTSDLPHITAVALVNSASYNENTQYFIAGGFRDATRVADINPELWSDLFLSNRENVIAEIENYQKQLERWKQAIADNDRDALKEIMREAGPRRRMLY